MSLSRRRLLIVSSALVTAFALSPSVQAEETPKPGGTAIYVAVGEPTTLVPLTDSNTKTREIATKILEGLVKFDAEFQPQPVLATQWNISDDGLRYTFKLRDGVKWHDGKDLTSADVKFTLFAFQKLGPRGRITFANVVDVETPDDLTAVVVLSKPTPYLLRALTGGETPILPAHAYPNDDYASSPNGNSPIGTGPFKFEEWQRGSFIRLSKNENYWQEGLPYLDGFITRFAGDGASAAIAIETGEADYSSTVPLSELERLKALPGIKVDVYSDRYLNNAQVLEFNLDNEILSNQAIRHALAQAVDRQFIIDNIYFGTALAAGSNIPAVFSAYNDEASFNYPFDLDKANALLDDAGYPRGADGTRFSLKLAFAPGDAFRKTAEYLRSAFGEVGVKVDVRDGDLATFIKRVYTDRDFDLTLNGISRLFDPIVGVQRLYWSDGIKNIAPYVNAAHYNNQEVDDLFRAAGVEVDETKRADLFKNIQSIVGKDLPNFSVVALPTVITSNERLHNIVSTIDINSSDLATAWKSE